MVFSISHDKSAILCWQILALHKDYIRDVSSIVEGMYVQSIIGITLE